ncbi:MAG: hypothetical protein ACE5EZ_05440 [Thermodesulfobacteriota bacterium]
MKIWLFIASPFLMMTLAVATALSWDFNDSTAPRIENLFSNMTIERIARPLKGLDLRGLKRGPFRDRESSSLGGSGRKEKGNLKVDLIIISDKKSIAVVDGQVLSTGDSINGLRVKRIEGERVLFAGKKSFWRYLEKR